MSFEKSCSTKGCWSDRGKSIKESCMDAPCLPMYNLCQGNQYPTASNRNRPPYTDPFCIFFGPVIERIMNQYSCV